MFGHVLRPPYPGLLRSRCAGHGVDQVAGRRLARLVAQGDVEFAVAVVVSDGGVVEHGGHGWAVARPPRLRNRPKALTERRSSSVSTSGPVSAPAA